MQDLPLPLGVPWWMAAAAITLWVAMVVGIVRIAVYLLRSRRAGRTRYRAGGRPPTDPRVRALPGPRELDPPR